MGTYRGPHTEVIQNFELNAPATAVESLPSAVIATAYDVYEKQGIGRTIGTPALFPWGSPDVLFDESVSGKRDFDFYPAKVFADTDFGNIAIDAELSETGVEFTGNEMAVIPNTTKTSGIIPYYKKEGIAGDVTLLNADKQSVNIKDGSAKSTKIKIGQRVFVYSGSAWIFVGTVGAVPSSEDRIRLSTPYTGSEITSGSRIVVGAASISSTNFADTLFDPKADFITNKVKIGDVVVLNSKGFQSPVSATVVSIINKNTLRFNTTVLPSGHQDYNFGQVFPQVGEPVVEIPRTVDVQLYHVGRLLGFTENYKFKNMNITVPNPLGSGVEIDEMVGDSGFKYVSTGAVALSVGDVFIITNANPADGALEKTTYAAGLKVYRVESVAVDGPHFVITTDRPIQLSAATPVTTLADVGDFISAWKVVAESDINADFRSIRTQEKGVVKRIGSIDDIVSTFSKSTTISVYNDLAYMLQIAFSKAGGKVCYGGHVSSKNNERLTQYSDILEELKLVDVYSHCFGTTDAGVNGLIGSYVEGQSEPYEAHERVGIITYDQKDIFKMGSDSGDVSAVGIITTTGTFNPSSAGLTTKDQVEIYNGETLVGTFTVLETPSTNNVITTSYRGDALTDASLVFVCGRKDAQAVRIGAIKYGVRRVKVLWPGYFRADVAGKTKVFPPYYIAAARCGMDCGLPAKQSCTNYQFSIPGLSNIVLDTNFYFRKEQLDETGGGGVDIMIQSSSPSQTIKSRHDLTSNMDAIEYREWSITKQADTSAKTYRNAVDPYVGKYNITDELLRFLGQVVSIASSTLIPKVIQNASIISISRDTLIVDKINMVIAVTVYVPGNTFEITLNIKSK